MTNAYQAMAAYKASQRLDERPATVLARSHEELAHVLGAAISAYEARQLEEMCRHNARAVQILATLMGAFAGDAPERRRLRAMYSKARGGVNGLLIEPTAPDTVRAAQAWAREMAMTFRKESMGLS